MDLWLASIALFAIGATLSAINTLTTIVKLRCEGMTWERLPLTVWGWFTAALLSILAFSVLLAAILLLFCDRHLRQQLLPPRTGPRQRRPPQHRGDGSPLLWLHLFWFFGHPEVYIAILPGMGLTSMVHRQLQPPPRLRLPPHDRDHTPHRLPRHHRLGTPHVRRRPQPLRRHRLQHLHHGHRHPRLRQSPQLARHHLGIAPPSSRTPMLFALGFVSLFITGGLTGPILAQPILDEYLHNTFFVVAHFHLIMAMAGVFGLFCATYYWVAARSSDRTARPNPSASLHFWATLLGAYSTFLPMHFTGLAGEPRHYAQLTGIASPGATLLAIHPALQRTSPSRPSSSSARSSSSSGISCALSARPATIRRHQSLARHHHGVGTQSPSIRIQTISRPSSTAAPATTATPARNLYPQWRRRQHH